MSQRYLCFVSFSFPFPSFDVSLLAESPTSLSNPSSPGWQDMQLYSLHCSAIGCELLYWHSRRQLGSSVNTTLRQEIVETRFVTRYEEVVEESVF